MKRGRLKGVKTVKAKGQLYYYHRKTMTRLPGEPYSAEFVAKLYALDQKVAKAAAPLDTLALLIVEYKRSAEFTTLEPSTRAQYQRIFDYLKPIAGDLPVSRIDIKFLYNLRDRALEKKKRAFTNMTISVLRLLFNWGVKRHNLTANPAEKVDKIGKPKNAKVYNRPWQQDELDLVLAEAPEALRVVVAIGAFVGLRESDAVRVTWAAYDGRTVQMRTKKTGSSISVPAHRRLREILDAAPRLADTIVVGRRGRTLSLPGMRDLFYRTIRKLIADGKIQPGLSLHGLRHTLGTRLAEAGCDPGTIAAVLGHADIRSSEHYSRTANRARLAQDAIERMENEEDRQRENVA